MGYAKKDQRDGGYRYTYRGRVFPSVTTITGGGVPKPALAPWAAREAATWAVKNLDEIQRLLAEDREDDAIAMIKSAPYRTSNRAASLGTAVHAAAEAHGKGEALPAFLKGDARAPFVKQFLKFIDDYVAEPVITERKVFNLTHTYAGTLDSIQTLDTGRLAEAGFNVEGLGDRTTALVDYKSGKDVYGEVALQLAAYRYAEFYVEDDEDEKTRPMIPVERTYVLHIRPRHYSLFEVTADERVFKWFRAVKAVYEFTTIADTLIKKAG